MFFGFAGAQMSGYKRVSFYELCRLCASNNQKDKTHIFQEEGRKIQLQSKIKTCLSLSVFQFCLCADIYLNKRIFRCTRMISCQKSFARNVYRVWKLVIFFSKNVLALKQCCPHTFETSVGLKTLKSPEKYISNNCSKFLSPVLIV